jgi:hypothetical protein
MRLSMFPPKITDRSSAGLARSARHERQSPSLAACIPARGTIDMAEHMRRDAPFAPGQPRRAAVTTSPLSLHLRAQQVADSPLNEDRRSPTPDSEDDSIAGLAGGEAPGQA